MLLKLYVAFVLFIASGEYSNYYKPLGGGEDQEEVAPPTESSGSIVEDDIIQI